MIMPGSWGGFGSAAVTFVFFMDMFRRYCPEGLRLYLDKCRTRLSEFFNPYVEVTINQYIADHLSPHEAYSIVEAYLSDHSDNARRLKAKMTKKNDSRLMFSMNENEKVTDVFQGVEVTWTSKNVVQSHRQSRHREEPDNRYYELKFHKRHKKKIKEAYVEHVIKRGREIESRNRQRKVFTNSHKGSSWSHVVFEPPARFETLAMEPELKEEIIDDLLTFTKSKDYYARIGKPWKRGYLLYGPPGTGKSSMIGAMANLLDYDVYDLELTSVKENMDLRKLLMETKPKSIIVIEDIDCSLHLTGQRKKKEEESGDDQKVEEKEKKESGSKVTLSGLLNVIDGLWSACAGERIIVFTTNYVDKLDPALTRSGRMDKHIELSYCRYGGFKVLAKNYLDLDEHPLFQSVEELIEEVEITPADVTAKLTPNSAKQSPEQCLRKLICTLEQINNRKCARV